MIDDKEFAARIRAARAYLGETLEDAGESLGLSPHQLSRRERADRNGYRFSAADRYHLTAVYSERTGWPEAFFSSAEIPPIAPLREVEDDLDPTEVVERVEDRRDDDGEEVGPP